MRFEIRKVFAKGHTSRGRTIIEADSAEEAEKLYLEKKNFKRKVAGLQINPLPDREEDETPWEEIDAAAAELEADEAVANTATF
jgi:adenine C2-methylase RlmN of 23S rRNA A2503 and tRNA A37